MARSALHTENHGMNSFRRDSSRRFSTISKDIASETGFGSLFMSETFHSFSSQGTRRNTTTTDISTSGNLQIPATVSAQGKDDFHAWLACVAAFFDTGLLFGLMNIYSLFLVEFQEDMGASLTSAATLGSLNMGLLMLFGPLSSYLTMRFGNRFMMMIGSFMCAASLFGSSYVKTFNPLFATFAIPFALGTALVNTPAYVIPMEYFKKYQAITTGIVASGGSMGMLLMAPVVKLVIDRYGWRMAFRGLSVTFFMLIFVNALVRPIMKPFANKIDAPTGNTLCEDLKLWNNRVFVLWVSVISIVYFGYNIPLIFLTSYTAFVGSTSQNASYLLMVMGGATSISRLVMGVLLTCDLLSRLHVKQIIFVLMGTVHLLLAHVKTTEGLYVFAVVRGLLDGAHAVMLPNLTASIVGAKRAILAWGHLAGAMSITYTLGPMAAGAVKNYTGSYVGPFIMSGLPLIAAGLLLFLLPWAQRSYKDVMIKKLSQYQDPSAQQYFLDLVEEAEPMEDVEDYIQQQAYQIEEVEKIVTAMASSAVSHSTSQDTPFVPFLPPTEETFKQDYPVMATRSNPETGSWNPSSSQEHQTRLTHSDTSVIRTQKTRFSI